MEKSASPILTVAFCGVTLLASPAFAGILSSWFGTKAGQCEQLFSNAKNLSPREKAAMQDAQKDWRGFTETMQFVPVPAGELVTTVDLLGHGYNKSGDKPISIEVQAFAITNTLLTQYVYAKVMGEVPRSIDKVINPSNDTKGFYSGTTDVNGQKVRMVPRNAADSMTYNEAVEVAETLTRMGTSADPKRRALLLELDPGYQPGDTYELASINHMLRVHQLTNLVNPKTRMTSILLRSNRLETKPPMVAMGIPHFIGQHPIWDLDGPTLTWITGRYSWDFAGALTANRAVGYAAESNDTYPGNFIAERIDGNQRYREVGLRLIRIRLQKYPDGEINYSAPNAEQ